MNGIYSKKECKKLGGKWSKRSRFTGECTLKFNEYDLYAVHDMTMDVKGNESPCVFLRTEEDRSVGVYGEIASPCFDNLSQLNKWFGKHENEYAKIIELNDKDYWNAMKKMSRKRR
jgi:hypothetical protein